MTFTFSIQWTNIARHSVEHFVLLLIFGADNLTREGRSACSLFRPFYICRWYCCLKLLLYAWNIYSKSLQKENSDLNKSTNCLNWIQVIKRSWHFSPQNIYARPARGRTKTCTYITKTMISFEVPGVKNVIFVDSDLEGRLLNACFNIIFKSIIT